MTLALFVMAAPSAGVAGTAFAAQSGGTSSDGSSLASDAAIQLIEQAPTGDLHWTNGTIAKARLMASDNPGLPLLPTGLRYAPDVRDVTVTRNPTTQHATNVPAGRVSPESASGCTPYGGSFPPFTCILIDGNGAVATYWTTSTWIDSYSPSAFYEINGSVYEVNSVSTGSNSGYALDPIGFADTYINYLSGSPTPISFGDFDHPKVCNSWNGSAAGTATACETIHKG